VSAEKFKAENISDYPAKNTIFHIASKNNAFLINLFYI
jgi:hypothetical protein